MSKVLWIVPARRAVIQQQISYRELMLEWLTSLKTEDNEKALSSWYKIPRIQQKLPQGFINGWVSTLSGGQVKPVARDVLNQLNSSNTNFRLRLWKAPMRVLLEAKAEKSKIESSEPVKMGENIAPHNNELNYIHRKENIKLTLNSDGEVTNPDAIFLMGDVVEFPLFKFLAMCGNSDFGEYDASFKYNDKLSFNGKGSFYLGTSVKTSDGESPPKSPDMHDNLVAMRFQMLLSGGLAAFYHLDPVFTEEIKRTMFAKDGDETVYARGFIYSGVFRSGDNTAKVKKKVNGKMRRVTPSNTEDYPWKIHDLHWCEGVDKKGNMALPNASGFSGLGNAGVVTPGWSCSPCTLMLANFMMRHFKQRDATGDLLKYSGGGSVGKTFTQSHKAAIRNTFEPLWQKKNPKDDSADNEKLDILGFTKKNEPSLRNKLKSFIDEINDVLSMIEGESSFVLKARRKINTNSGLNWDILSEHIRKKLEPHISKNDFSALIDKLNVLQKKRISDDENRALNSLQHDLIGGAQAFAKKVDELRNVPEWLDYQHVVKISKKSIDVWIRDVNKGKINQRRTKSLIRNLGKKKVKLSQKYMDSDPSLPAGKRKSLSDGLAIVDMTDNLSDINIFNMNGHEVASVRLYSQNKLLKYDDLPTSGFMAAYNPLTGKSFSDSISRGQFYIFEAAGRKKVAKIKENGKTKFDGHSFTCGPFKWKRIEDNKYSFFKTKSNSIKYIEGVVSRKNRFRSKALLGVYGIKVNSPDVLRGTELLAQIHSQEPRAFRPLYISPIKNEIVARKRLLTNGNDIYASRAVPFPTLLEVSDAFYSIEEVAEAMQLSRKYIDNLAIPYNKTKNDLKNIKMKLENESGLTSDEIRELELNRQEIEDQINGTYKYIEKLSDLNESIGGAKLFENINAS